MNQIPPNDNDQPGFARTPPASPYESRRVDGDPDLDANSPYLRADDVQRLNRKALLFLAAIVLLLGALALWLFSGGLSGDDEEASARPKSEQVVIPAAPRDLPELPPEQPIPMAPPVSDLPPLPVMDDGADSADFAGNMPDVRSMAGQEASLLERRMEDAAGGGLVDGNGEAGDDAPPGGLAGLLGAGEQGGGAVASRGPADGPTSARPLNNANTLLLRGTYIRCILQSRVISDFPGYTSCIVTEPVYSVNGRRLLLPRGSKVQGTYDPEIIGDRVGIIWDRVTTPSGLDINMRSPSVDMLGSAGNPGHYSAHWAQRVSSALLISLLSDAFKYAGAKNGPQETAIVNGAIVQSPYESNTARTMERLANLALERNMSRPATVTINQGTIVNVYVARDVDFAAVLR